MKAAVEKLLVIGLGLFLALTGGAQPVITQQPTNQVLALGGTMTLGVTAGGTAPLAYQWFENSRWLLDATNSTLLITNAGIANSGNYYVLVTNVSGMVISLPVLVTVGNPTLLSWGFNQYGQLGNGTTNSSTNNASLPFIVMSNVVAGAAGYQHSSFVKADGTFWAMGYNADGQLGNGTTINTNLPVRSIASNVVAVAAGQYYSLIIKTNGTLWGMGFNLFGQLGNGTMGIGNNYPTPISVASNVVAMAAGTIHSVFVKTNGTLWAMGNNSYGQLGNGTSGSTQTLPISVASNVVLVAIGEDYCSLFVKRDMTLWTTGLNNHGQLGNGTTNNVSTPVCVASNVVAIAAGAFHSLFITTDGTLWAMGYNANGQLGNGTTNDSLTPISVASNVVAVAAGQRHSLFVTKDGMLWAMGLNIIGQLGDGTTNDAYTPIIVPRILVANVFPSDAANHSLITGILQPPIIGNFTASSTNGNQLALQLAGTPNYPYILQSATNLTPLISWKSIRTNNADTNGNWLFIDTNLNAGQKFYRAVGQ